MRALAKHIVTRYSLNASLDSIISAIRRFQGQDEIWQEEKSLLSVFKNSVVSTKNNVACLTLNLSSKEFFQKAASLPNHYPYKVVVGDREVKLVTDKPHLEKVKSFFNNSDIAKIEDGLSEISVRLSDIANQMKGVLARLANELALANIIIHEIIICPPEFFIYLKQKDIVKAHDSILKLSQE